MSGIVPVKYSIVFQHDQKSNQINCRIETPHLFLESFDIKKHLEAYCRIFGNQKNFSKYGDGKAWERKEIVERVTIWHKRWMEGNPFSALAIIRKVDNKIIGHWVVGGGSGPGISEIAYMIDYPFWNRRYGTEAGIGIMKNLVPKLKKYQVEGAPFRQMEATVRPDNIASIKILETIGFTCVKEDANSRFGSVRKNYQFVIKA